VKIEDAGLKPDIENANQGTQRGLGLLDKSLRKLGAGRSILVDKDGNVIAGNKTLDRAADINLPVRIVETDGTELVVVKRTDLDLYSAEDTRARQLAYADNKISELDLAWKPEQIAIDFEPLELGEWGFEMPLDGDNEESEQPHTTLAERFIVPPFSVLDARQGYWQDRKRSWIALGIQSEIGRGERITCPGDAITEQGLNYYRNQNKTLGAIAPNENGENGILASPGKYATNNGLLGISKQARTHYAGREVATSNSSQQRLTALQKTGNSRAEVFGTEGNISEQSGTSIFDPVLCELAYRWFMPKGGNILDPFAGGSVRGIMATLLGHDYTGIDLRPEQIEANEKQASEITPDKLPHWITGDSQNIKELAPGEYDFIFSCPPYFDLELYSDDPADLSNAGDYDEFIKVYRAIISACVSMLKDNRFACFVVGDIRDKRGFYRNFPADTIQAFEDAGAILYNDAILVTAVGSLPIRTTRMFQSGRKLGKTHQNVLVFYKGDPKNIKSFGDVECGDIPEPELSNT
jgi:DNA modification methylase